MVGQIGSYRNVYLNSGRSENLKIYTPPTSSVKEIVMCEAEIPLLSKEEKKNFLDIEKQDDNSLNNVSFFIGIGQIVNGEVSAIDIVPVDKKKHDYYVYDHAGGNQIAYAGNNVMTLHQCHLQGLTTSEIPIPLPLLTFHYNPPLPISLGGEYPSLTIPEGTVVTISRHSQSNDA